MAELFGGVYPELHKHKVRVQEIIADEEESFGRTLLKGIEQFKKIGAAAAAATPKRNTVNGAEVGPLTRILFRPSRVSL